MKTLLKLLSLISPPLAFVLADLWGVGDDFDTKMASTYWRTWGRHVAFVVQANDLTGSDAVAADRLGRYYFRKWHWGGADYEETLQKCRDAIGRFTQPAPKEAPPQLIALEKLGAES